MLLGLIRFLKQILKFSLPIRVIILILILPSVLILIEIEVFSCVVRIVSLIQVLSDYTVNLPSLSSLLAPNFLGNVRHNLIISHTESVSFIIRLSVVKTG